MVQRLHLAPVRCGFWRSSSDSTQASTQASAEDSEGKGLDSTGPSRPEEGANLSRQHSRNGSSLQRTACEKRPPKHRSASGSGAGEGAGAGAEVLSMGPLSFSPDDMLGAVEPFGAQLLELQKLSGFQGQIRYSPTRNRQCHIYVITERLNARSAPLKRVFLRSACCIIAISAP